MARTSDKGPIGGFYFNETDGGKVILPGSRHGTGDCVVRALAIATDTPYADVAREVIRLQKKAGKRKPLNYAQGVEEAVYGAILKKAGFIQVNVGKRGSHFTRINLQKNRTYVLHSYAHVVAVVNGVFHDNMDSRRNDHDGFSYSAPTASFGDTSIHHTNRPKTIVIKDFWVKQL